MNLKFFTHVSHELRTPLTLIISPLETLMKEYQSDAVLMDKLNIVQRNAVRLLNLVNQLLDFRKIDVNGYYLSLSDDDIISYIHTICDSFISLSEQKDVSLTFYSAVSSLNMLFDGDKMREVMMSLLSNAFKFTCSGGRVDVFVSLVEGQDSREMLEIRVADTGIGIKKEDRERIFGHFYQVDYPDMSFSGGGGSLSIVRDFVTLHDGTVNVMDNTPVGCVFIIHIPVKRSGGKPMKIEQVQVVDKSVEDISTLQVPESYVASNVGEESKEELNHIITIEGLEEDIRRLESGNTEEIAEEKNTRLMQWIGISSGTNSFPRSNTRRSSLHSLLTETTWAACTCFKSCSARVRSSMGDNLTRTCDAFSSSKFSKAETSGSHSLIAIVLPPCPSRRAGSMNIQSTGSIICR